MGFWSYMFTPYDQKPRIVKVVSNSGVTSWQAYYKGSIVAFGPDRSLVEEVLKHFISGKLKL
jgi:hypothetical protein